MSGPEYNHTKARWFRPKTQPFMVCAKKQGEIARISERFMDRAEREANAILIEMAPALLAERDALREQRDAAEIVNDHLKEQVRVLNKALQDVFDAQRELPAYPNLDQMRAYVARVNGFAATALAATASKDNDTTPPGFCLGTEVGEP